MQRRTEARDECGMPDICRARGIRQSGLSCRLANYAYVIVHVGDDAGEAPQASLAAPSAPAPMMPHLIDFTTAG